MGGGGGTDDLQSREDGLGLFSYGVHLSVPDLPLHMNHAMSF